MKYFVTWTSTRKTRAGYTSPPLGEDLVLMMIRMMTMVSVVKMMMMFVAMVMISSSVLAASS